MENAKSFTIFNHSLICMLPKMDKSVSNVHILAVVVVWRQQLLNERRLEKFYFVRIKQDLHVLFSDAASDVVNNIGAKNGVAGSTRKMINSSISKPHTQL